MSAFLWVEDFDGNARNKYAEVASYVFSKALNVTPDAFPNELGNLVRFLAERGITLATTYAEGRRLITERLDDFDFVILDIELELNGEDASDRSWVEPELVRWHGYQRDLDDKANDEESESNAKREMRKVAGYHLWTHLIIDRGFPRDHIQFCSQHGEHLISIEKSFTPAKIVAPKIFRKGDGRTGNWVAERFRNPYFSLRRNVTDYCAAVFDCLSACSGDGKSFLRLSRMPGPTTQDFDLALAIEYVEGLPRYLPQRVDEQHAGKALLAFVRGMVIEWDRFNPAKDSNRNYGDEYKERMGKSYDEAVEPEIRVSASVLKLLRNTVSHRGSSAIEFNCLEVALFFVLNMNTVFDLSGISTIKRPEDCLLGLQVTEWALDKETLKNQWESLTRELGYLATRYGVTAHRLSAQLRGLQNASSPDYQRDAAKWLFIMLWDELAGHPRDGRFFSDRVEDIRIEDNIIDRIAIASLPVAIQ